MSLHGWTNRTRRWWHGIGLRVWYDPAYRLPLPGLELATGFEPRRADFAAWYLRQSHAVARADFRQPEPCTWDDLARVHTHEFLDALSRPEELARVFSVDPGLLPVDELLQAIRLSVGATIESARELVQAGSPRLGRRALNLLGGFHHAGPARATGFCPVNDIAVAVRALRVDGFDGRVGVLDFDAHPPDGTAECLQDDSRVWIGSISGCTWGPFAREVDETVLPGAGDGEYLEAVDALLGRMPRDLSLAFVIAGGDVLQGDPLGALALTLDGARHRDLHVSSALLSVPSIWLPGGGYTTEAWKVLAGTGLALGLGSRGRIPAAYDPLGVRYAELADTMQREHLGPTDDFSMDDVAAELGQRSESRRPVLGFYSAQGLEHALQRYGFLRQLERLGYRDFRADTGYLAPGDRIRIFGRGPDGEEHLLIEVVLERREISREPVLYCHWLTLRHPLAAFSSLRPRLPGQEVPGLGLVREVSELLQRMAHRLGLSGVAFRPASYHTAFTGREVLCFAEPSRQGRFEALIRDLGHLSLLEATRALAEGRVRLDGAVYRWEPDEMVRWNAPPPVDEPAIEAARERFHFTVEPPAPPAR